MSHVLRALGALVFFAFVAGHSGQVHADAISDQKKVYKALGIKIQPELEKCTIFTQRDAERVLGRPVVHAETEMVKSACAYKAANDPKVGVLVDRGPRSDWTVPKTNSNYYGQVHRIEGIGEDAYTLYENGLGYEADVLTSKGVITVNLSGVGTAAMALEIARTVMNR